MQSPPDPIARKAVPSAPWSGFVPWVALAALVCALHSPRWLALEAGLAAAAAIGLATTQRIKASGAYAPLPITLLLFASYALSSSLWSLNPVASLGKPAFLILMIAGTLAGLELTRGMGAELMHRRLRLMVMAALVALALSASEVWTDEYLQSRIFTAFPSLFAGMKRHVMLDEQGQAIILIDTNIKRRIAMLTLWIWPVALAVRACLDGWARWAAWLWLLAAVTAMIVLGPHQSSRLAIGAGFVMLLAMHANEKWSLRALAVSWGGYALLAIPIAFGLHSARLHEPGTLPDSARARIVIWNATAQETLKRPLLGIGADATIVAKERYERARSSPEEAGVPLTIERHAHSLYLQVWFELGAIGALLLAATIIALVASVRTLPCAARPMAAAQLVTVGALVFSSYGMWQMWFQAALAVGAFGLIMAARAVSLDGSS